MTSLDLTRHDEGDGVVRIAAAGEIDLVSSGQLDVAIRAAVTGGNLTTLVIDLGKVTYLDSVGITALLAGQKLAAEHNVGYTVTNLRRPVYRILEVTGLLPVLTGQR